MKWEYKEINRLDESEADFVNRLIELGKQGWEVVDINKKYHYGGSYKAYLLKRPLEEK